MALGGDEFGVILAQADMAQAEEKAGQLMEIIHRSQLIWEGHQIDLSCAVGIHQFVSEQSADDALSQADASMYKQKRRHYEKKKAQ